MELFESFWPGKGKNTAKPATASAVVMGGRATPWLPHMVEQAGGITAWNAADAQRAYLLKTMGAICQATTAEAAILEVKSIMSLGHNLWAYAYMRTL